MDGSVLEHSDSDSGESWTLLDNSPSVADEAPEFSESHPAQAGDAGDITDKDEDTDGISIISDSDPESATSCDMGYVKCALEENCPTEEHETKYISNPQQLNSRTDHESVKGEHDFLGDNTGKHKTYVHRRNKRLSTVLNIIVLGSVITAAGVAIGHMWGARHDCSMHNTPSVNKILSNLYKLQEENVYLRNKLKELTLMNNMRMQQKKIDPGKLSYKQNKCKKLFEESLTSKNVERITKCVDNEYTAGKVPDSHLMEQAFEKDFLSDIDKLKNVYQQNKSWLDEEIARRLKNEEVFVKVKNNLKSPKSIKINEEHRDSKKVREPPKHPPAHAETLINITELVDQPTNVIEEINAEKLLPDKRISYADSLKSEHIMRKREVKNETKNETKEYMKKKKYLKDYDMLSGITASDDDLKKDDRYNSHKLKTERQMHDRQKSYKKQKRRNKYEQWELKGGYMKDYDDFSITSAHENDFVLKNADKNDMSRDFERNNYISQFPETENSMKNSANAEDNIVKFENKKGKEKKGRGKKNKEMDWYEKRAALRSEARKKLEQELFGESTPNNAGWYFRRMQKREQCRVKGDNSTYRKLSRRNLNFKIKH